MKIEHPKSEKYIWTCEFLIIPETLINERNTKSFQSEN